MPGYNHVKHMNVIALDGLIKIQVVIKNYSATHFWDHYILGTTHFKLIICELLGTCSFKNTQLIY